MEIGTDFKVVLISVIAVIIAVLVTSFYFALTTPAGQQGLAGMFQGFGNSIMSALGSIFAPITAFFNGIATAITHFFSHPFGL